MVDTDRQDVVISGLNDYTGGKLKGEASDFQTSKTLKTAKLCSATHAGHEDNPKGKKTNEELLKLLEQTCFV